MRLYDYAGSANAYKIRLLLHQLEIPYERVAVDIFRGESRTPEFLAKNPMGQVPVLELDDGRCIAESNAILFHLARRTPLLPDEAFAQTTVLQWLLFEQYNVEPTVGSVRFWKLTGRAAARGDEVGRRLEQARGALATLERVIEGRRFLTGDAYTIADLALYAYAHVAPEAGLDLAPYAGVRAWFARIEAQPRFIPGPDPYGAAAHV